MAGWRQRINAEALGARLKTLLVLRPLESRRMPAWMITLNPMKLVLAAGAERLATLQRHHAGGAGRERCWRSPAWSSPCRCTWGELPSQSEATLWVLFGGVMLSPSCSNSIMRRMLRVHISDVVGKRADLRISERVLLTRCGSKSGARSKSTGSFIALNPRLGRCAS